jgi:hypothetical protein
MADQPKPDPDERTPAEKTDDVRELREKLREEMEKKQPKPDAK